ncbi:phage tail tube protein [Zhongshania sp.]|uniref:phage tail tube protein n=1 Tax=Zhongshania sp. TaxID=1971902 RepID=UPI003568172D
MSSSSQPLTSTNRIEYSYVEESELGVTPASPNFQALPVTGASLDGNISTEQSQTIRTDRQTDDLITVDSEIGGDLNFEVTYAPYKPLLTALMQNNTSFTFSDVDTDVSATWDNNARTLTLSSVNVNFSTLSAGRFVRVDGFTNAGNNGIFRVISVPDADTLVLRVPPSAKLTPATEGAGNSVTVDVTSSVRNGNDVPKCYTFQKSIGGLPTNAIFYYRGVQVAGANFTFSVGSILTAVMNLMGLTEQATDTAIAGQTVAAIPAYKIMNSVSSLSKVDVVKADGTAVGTRYENLTLNIGNNIQAAKQLGTLGAAGLASFTVDVSGEVRLYFQDITVYQSFANSEAFAISLVVEDASGNAIALSLPYVKFENLDKPVEGRDSFFFTNGTFRGLREPTENYTVQIDFFDAP